MSEDENIYIPNEDLEDIQEEPISDVESASSESTGSAFGGLPESLQSGDRDKQPGLLSNAAKKFLQKKQQNSLPNLGGKGEKVPDALSKRKSPNFSNNQNNKQINNKNSAVEKANNAEGEEKSGIEKIKETKDAVSEEIVKKGGSAALQAYGVPKPVADLAADKIAGPLLKLQKMKTKIIIVGVIAIFALIVICAVVAITVYYEPLIQGFEAITEAISQTQHKPIGLLDIRLTDLNKNNLLILTDDNEDSFWGTNNESNKSGKSKSERQREQFHTTLRELAKDDNYKNIQWNIALASVLYGVSSERDIYDGYCEIELFDTCVKWDKDPSLDYNDAESNLKKIAKRLKKGKSEYEDYMLNTYIPKYFSKKMEKENKTAEDILNEIYKMASIVGELFPETSTSYISNICPGGINVLAGSNSTRFPAANNLSLEEYVAGGLSSEYSGANSSASETELMKAMAIAIRSNIVKKVKGTADSNGVCTVINSTNFQTYREPTERTIAVAEATAGQVLMYNDDVMMLHYSIFPGSDADGWSSSTPCENSVCSGGMCSAMLYKDPGNEKAYFSVPQSYAGYSDVSNIDNSHCHGLSTVVASYYASSQSLTYDKIINLFVSDGVTISKLSSGEQMLPLEFDDPTTWRDNTSRIYQIGDAGCYKNGVLVGRNCSHLGIDFAYYGINGKPVFAFAPGVVIESTYNAGGYGYTVKIGHDIDGDGKYDYYSRYGHMQNSLKVSTGEVVAAGVQLGVVGSTGNSTGPHLHFELYSSAGRSVEDYYNTRPDLMMDRIAEGKIWYEK